jgi:uncharacterized membrane protein
VTTLSSFQSACGWGVGTRRERKAFSVLTFHHFFSPQKQEDMMTMTMRAFSPTVTLTRRKDSPSSSSRSAKCTTTTTTTKACLTTTRTHPFSAPLKAHRRLHIRATNDDDDSKKARKEEDKEDNSLSSPWAQPGYKGAWVSQQDDRTQILVVVSIWIGLCLLTYVSCAKVGPFVEELVPDFVFQFSKRTWPLLGLTYVLAGAAHFALPEGFDAMVPHENAFGGLWKLPGSKRFHVNWTGACEIVGGLGTLSLVVDPNSSLGKVSAFGLFALTLAVTPREHVYIYEQLPGTVTPGRHGRDDGVDAAATLRQRFAPSLSVDDVMGRRHGLVKNSSGALPWWMLVFTSRRRELFF